MEDVARVVLAMEQHDVAEEVMHFLDRSGHARVVATAADDRQLREAMRQLEPDAVIGQPSLLADVARTRPFLAIDTRESVGSLRAAIRAGADGFFVWPVDREALSIAAAATRASARRARPARERRRGARGPWGSRCHVRRDASRARVRSPGERVHPRRRRPIRRRGRAGRRCSRRGRAHAGGPGAVGGGADAHPPGRHDVDAPRRVPRAAGTSGRRSSGRSRRRTSDARSMSRRPPPTSSSSICPTRSTGTSPPAARRRTGSSRC